MSDEGQKVTYSLEQVLDKLLDFQSNKQIESTDAMLMLSLLNLLGIVSAMNRHLNVNTTQVSGSMDSTLGMLLNMLSGQQHQTVNLVGLPDLGALMKILGGFMGGAVNLPTSQSRSGDKEKKQNNKEIYPTGRKDIKKVEGPIKWGDSRLGAVK